MYHSIPSETSPDQGRTLTLAWLLATVACILAVTLPVLSAGYGHDADSWLVARVAGDLWVTGRYAVSRFPGYPLHEIISAPLVGLGGCVASNAGSLAATLGLVAVWYRVVRRIGKHERTLFLSLALAPLVLVNAAVTIDYLWSLLFILLSLDATTRRKAIAAGIFTGVAAGFRPSNFSVAVPLLLLFWKHGGRGPAFRYVLTAAIASLAAFLPMLLTYGPIDWVILTRAEMSDVHPPPLQRVLFFGYRTIYALGPLAAVTAAAILFGGRERLRDAVSSRDPMVLASVTMVSLSALQFFLLPLERSYLLPALPFLLLLIDRVGSARGNLLVCLAILSLNLFNPDILRHDREGPTASFSLRAGRLLEAWKERTDMARDRGWESRDAVP